MAKKKCATGDTHVPAPARRTPVRTGAHPPVRPRAGSLVEVTLVSGKPQLGVVMEAKGGGDWGTQWLDILFEDGERFILRSPNVRVINYRRRKSTKARTAKQRNGKGG